MKEVRETLYNREDYEVVINLFDMINSELKAQNESLRNEVAELKQPSKDDKSKLLMQKMKEVREILYNREDYEVAIKLCDMIIELKPNDADTYYNRGIAYSKLGRVHTKESIIIAKRIKPEKIISSLS